MEVQYQYRALQKEKEKEKISLGFWGEFNTPGEELHRKMLSFLFYGEEGSQVDLPLFLFFLFENQPCTKLLILNMTWCFLFAQRRSEMIVVKKKKREIME